MIASPGPDSLGVGVGVGDPGPLPPQQPLPSPGRLRGGGVSWRRPGRGGGGAAKAPPSIPGAPAAVTHISTPAVRLLLWP